MTKPEWFFVGMACGYLLGVMVMALIRRWQDS